MSREDGQVWSGALAALKVPDRPRSAASTVRAARCGRRWTVPVAGPAWGERPAPSRHPPGPVGEAVGRVVRPDDQPWAHDERPLPESLGDHSFGGRLGGAVRLPGALVFSK